MERNYFIMFVNLIMGTIAVLARKVTCRAVYVEIADCSFEMFRARGGKGRFADDSEAEPPGKNNSNVSVQRRGSNVLRFRGIGRQKFV